MAIAHRTDTQLHETALSAQLHMGPVTGVGTRAVAMVGELKAYLEMLAGSRPEERLLEVRYRNPRGAGMRQAFVPARRLDVALDRIVSLAAHSDTYTGVLLRDRRAGGKSAVSRSHLLFVEIDAADAYRRLLLAPAPPTAVITSGSEGHLHAYWQLDADVTPDQVELGNRKLAGLIGGDLVSVDAARILRPPWTWNFKYDPPVRTRLDVLESSRHYSFDELTGHLCDPAPRKPVPDSRPRSAATVTLTGPGTVDAHLRAIATEDYVTALTGQQPNDERKISCPFPEHGNGQEWIPSLQLRDGGEWNCFGCGTGGTIYDFAAHLWGISTKGREFKKLRERLAAELGISEPAGSTRSPQRPALTPARADTTQAAAMTAAGISR